MSDTTPNAAIITPAAVSQHRLQLLVGGVTASLVILALLAFWPYQHGQYEERGSILKGLYLLVRSPIGSEWLFCLLVPFITGFLIYLRRDSFRKLKINGSNWGIFLLAISLGIYWIGYRADSRYIGFASAQLMIGSLIIWFLGWNYMRHLLFPWLFLAFMWPFPPLEEMLAFPLRIFAAKSSTAFLNLLGVDCVREGTAIISLPHPSEGIERGALFQLDVDSPCSGIRSLFSLIMISVFYGYISLALVWQRAVLFTAAIPLAVMGNIIRMLILANGCILFGSEFAVGTEYPSTYHELSGIAVFIVALSGMFAIARFLEFKYPSSRKSKKEKEKPSEKSISAYGTIPFWRSATITAVGLLTVAVCYFTPAASSLSSPGVTATLPQSFDSYWGQNIPPSKAETEQLINNGVELSRYHYQSITEPASTATVIIGGPEGRTLHRPEVCLPGQGWQVTDSRKISFDLKLGGPPIDATLLSVMRYEPTVDGSTIQRHGLNLYWYVGNGRTAGSYNEHVTRSLYDSIFHNVNHRWSMVSLFYYMPTDDILGMLNEEIAIATLEKIARNVAPSILVDNTD